MSLRLSKIVLVAAIAFFYTLGITHGDFWKEQTRDCVPGKKFEPRVEMVARNPDH